MNKKVKVTKLVKQKSSTKSPIAVIGAGSWGTALALTLARNGNPVQLWSNEPEVVQSIREQNVNLKYLPDNPLHENMTVFDQLSDSLAGVQDIMMVVPSHAFRPVLSEVKQILSSPVRIAWGSKGLDPETCHVLSEVVGDVMGEDTPMVALAGPSFAKEVADGKPSAVSLAGNNDEFIDDMITRFHHGSFRVYKNPDFIGVQLCGAVKNVLAIAVGIADGLGFGANTRCALITRGLAEMARLCDAIGGMPATMMSLAGVGDLVLTCTDNQSRNRRFGLAIGKGTDADTALKEIGQAVEGLTNTRQVFQLGQQNGLEMPITEQVMKILFENHSPKEVVKQLLERESRTEF